MSSPSPSPMAHRWPRWWSTGCTPPCWPGTAWRSPPTTSGRFARSSNPDSAGRACSSRDAGPTARRHGASPTPKQTPTRSVARWDMQPWPPYCRRASDRSRQVRAGARVGRAACNQRGHAADAGPGRGGSSIGVSRHAFASARPGGHSATGRGCTSGGRRRRCVGVGGTGPRCHRARHLPEVSGG